MRCQESWTLTYLALAFFLVVHRAGSVSESAAEFNIARAPAPLFNDPVFKGAADPTAMFDPERNAWVVYYTQRRASELSLPNRSWCFGTQIGIAISEDQGVTWRYGGTAQGLHFEPGENTFWAPDLYRRKDSNSVTGIGATYHLHVTYIKAAAHQRAMRRAWGGDQRIAHYTTRDLLGMWHFQGLLSGLDKVLDPDLIKLSSGEFKLFFKDIRLRGQTAAALSTDLKHWRRLSTVEATAAPHEAPNVFYWKSKWWLLVDPMDEPGIWVFSSPSGAAPWVRQEEPILHWGGLRSLDSTDGKHVDVVVDGDRALIFYFVHPGRPCPQRQSLQFRYSVLQVAELDYQDGKLKCKRDKYVAWKKEKRQDENTREQRVVELRERREAARTAKLESEAAAIVARKESRANRKRPDGTYHGTPRAMSSSVNSVVVDSS